MQIWKFKMILKDYEWGRVSDFCLGVRTKLRQEQSQGEPVIGLSDLFQRWTQTEGDRRSDK